jgi:hypothetical protein
MGRYTKIIYLLLGVAIFISCKKEEKLPFANPTQIDLYFPLSDFLNERIADAGPAKRVVKEIRFNDETEEVAITMDNDVWRQELDFFFQADINKASLASSYETTEKPGLLLHQLKPNEKGNIKWIRVRKKYGKVSEIVILSENENLFYRSTVKGLVKMDDQEGISSYSMSGNQKVWFLSPTNLQVDAKVK